MNGVSAAFCGSLVTAFAGKNLITLGDLAVVETVQALYESPQRIIDSFSDGGGDLVAALRALEGQLVDIPEEARSSFEASLEGRRLVEDRIPFFLEMALGMIQARLEILETMVGPVDLGQMVWTPVAQDLEEQSWIRGELDRIGTRRLQAMALSAALVRFNAYAPYSHYPVGAVMLCASGALRGCNGENVNYTLTGHAETNAIAQAIQAGEVHRSGRRFLQAVVISHRDASSPCGGCRQAIVEHADNVLVARSDANGRIGRITSIKALLPDAFTPTALGIP